jgi:hypothetical protein
MKKYQVFLNVCRIFLTIIAVISLTATGHKIYRKYGKSSLKTNQISTDNTVVSENLQKIHKKKEEDHFLKRKLINAKHPIKKDNPIVVLITSYNNEKVCEKNLESVFIQNYDNYRLIYVDAKSKFRKTSFSKALSRGAFTRLC